MNRKTLKKIFKFIFTILLFTFLAIYFSQRTGYMEYNNKKKAELTAKQIKQFEKDVESGKEIDLKDYLKEDENHQNKLSNINLKVSQLTEKTVSNIINESFKVLGKLVQ